MAGFLVRGFRECAFVISWAPRVRWWSWSAFVRGGGRASAPLGRHHSLVVCSGLGVVRELFRVAAAEALARRGDRGRVERVGRVDKGQALDAHTTCSVRPCGFGGWL